MLKVSLRLSDKALSVICHKVSELSPASRLSCSSGVVLQGWLIKQEVSDWCIIDQVLMGKSSHQSASRWYALQPFKCIPFKCIGCSSKAVMITSAPLTSGENVWFWLGWCALNYHLLTPEYVGFSQSNDDLVNSSPIMPWRLRDSTDTAGA